MPMTTWVIRGATYRMHYSDHQLDNSIAALSLSWDSSATVHQMGGKLPTAVTDPGKYEQVTPTNLSVACFDAAGIKSRKGGLGR